MILWKKLYVCEKYDFMIIIVSEVVLFMDGYNLVIVV